MKLIGLIKFAVRKPRNHPFAQVGATLQIWLWPKINCKVLTTGNDVHVVPVVNAIIDEGINNLQ